MKTDLNDMLMFATVVDCGSFTAASERTGVPKANISRKVSKLEAHLGITLLERSTRSQNLTEAGVQFYQHCKRIQTEIDLAESGVQASLEETRGHLKIGASVAIGQYLLKPALGDFLHANPNIQLQVQLNNERVDLIEDAFDVLIRVGRLDDSRLIGKPLGKAHLRFFATKALLEKLGSITSIEQLQQSPLLLKSNHATHSAITLFNGSKKHVLNTEPRFISDDFSLIKQAMLDDLGIALLPDYMVRDELAGGEIKMVLANWQLEPVDIYALYPQFRAKLPKVRAFLELMTTQFETLLAQ